MFRGVTALNLDAKGRMAVPTRHRDRLRECCASQLVITADPDRCLLIYPAPQWSEIEAQLEALPSFNKSSRTLQRLYIGHAHEVEMDGQGRILLPPELRKFASLGKRVALVGQGRKFELWDEEAWNAKWDDEANLAQIELPPGMESLSI